MSVTYFLLLSSLGLAITTQAQDCSVPVGGDNMGLKGEHILSQTFPNGVQVSFACNTGYITAGGSPRITCTDGSWSPVRLKCEIKSCGNAGKVDNGEIHYPEGNEFGARVVVICKTGHKLVGRGEFYCGDEGWLGRLPECEAVTCSPPTSVVAGSFSPIEESYDFQQVVLFNCQKDYTLKGSNSLSCSEDGTFKPALPTCVKVECKDPDIKFAVWDVGSRPPHKYMSTVTYKSIPGYTMKGAATLTCGIDSQWLPGLPTSEPVECKVPVIDNAARDEGPLPPYKYMSTVTYKCKSGHTMKGAGTLTCGIEGLWTPGLPTCELIQCKGPVIKHAVWEAGFLPSYNYTSTVTFKCIPGYTMKGAGTLTCGIDGWWSPGLPTCELLSTTKRPSTTQKTIDTVPTDTPGNGGNSVAKVLGIVLAVIVIALGIGGLVFWRLRAAKKRRSGRSYPDNAVPKEGEELALS